MGCKVSRNNEFGLEAEQWWALEASLGRPVGVVCGKGPSCSRESHKLSMKHCVISVPLTRITSHQGVSCGAVNLGAAPGRGL